MACTDDTSLRVVVSGIAKKRVRRCGMGIIEEDDLGRFFRDDGCKVSGVRLVIDANRRGKSRGFGFVDFEDLESLDLALKLQHKEAKGLADKDGKLRTESAHAATDEGRTRQPQLSDGRNQRRNWNEHLPFMRPGSTNLFGR